MNIETINYIVKIAGFAADQLASGKTLKASKLWLADAMEESTTPYCHTDGVDFAIVNSRRSLIEATNARTKAIFANQCKTAIKGAESNRDDAVMALRVAHAITVAKRDHNVVLHAADVIEWANGDVMFNFKKAAHELAHAAKEAAANDPRTDDEGNDPREWCGNDIEAAHGEALTINVMVNIQRDVMAAPYLPALVEACHAEALEIAAQLEEYERRRAQSVAAPRTVDVKGICERMSQRAIDAVTADVLDLPKRKLGRPCKVIEVVHIEQIHGTGNALQSFRIHLSNDKRYEYTDGFHHCFVLAKNDKFKRMCRAPRIVEACRAAVVLHRRILA